MRQILPLKIQEIAPNPRPAARCVYKLTCFKLEGGRTREGARNVGPHGMCGSGDAEAWSDRWSVGITADSAVMSSSSDEIKTNMSHIWSQMTDGLCARISAVELFNIINIKYPPKEKLTLKTYIYFPYSNVNQISREAWKCWSCIFIVYKRQKGEMRECQFANFGFTSQENTLRREMFSLMLYFSCEGFSLPNSCMKLLWHVTAFITVGKSR